jgi:uncharacterized membrane protein YtjA (UPF0391 family)
LADADQAVASAAFLGIESAEPADARGDSAVDPRQDRTLEPAHPHGREHSPDSHARGDVSPRAAAFQAPDSSRVGQPQPLFHMLRWTLIFLVVALVAGLLGFVGIAGAAAGIAKIIFYIFLVLLVISLVAGMFGGGRHT